MENSGILKTPEATKRWVALIGLWLYLAMLLHPMIAHTPLWQVDLPLGISGHPQTAYETAHEDADQDCPLCNFCKNQNQGSASARCFEQPKPCLVFSEAQPGFHSIVRIYSTGTPRSPPRWSSFTPLRSTL